MIETFRCDDKDTLIAYLYGEIDAEGRREVERHLRTCAACARETEGLQSVRQDLQSWLPPEPELGFTIVQQPATVLRPSRWATLRSLPVWAQAAAALLVVAMGASIANVQVRYDRDGVSVSTGWMARERRASDPPVTRAAAPATQQESVALRAVPPASEPWREAFVRLERDLRGEIAQLRRAPGATVRASDAAGDSNALMRRVEALVAASEERQRQEMALRLIQAGRDWDIKRQADLMRINHDFGTLQGRALKTEAGQRDVINYLRRVSTQPIP